MADQIKYTQKLKDAKVLVIGGSSGIGFSVAEALTENGCHVIVSSSNQGRVEKTIEKLKKAYPSASSRVSGYAANLGDENTLESNIIALFEKVGKLDHVIFTAGDGLAKVPIAEADFSIIKQAGMVRFFAPLLVSKHAAKYLTGGPKSSITLTSGGVSERPIPDWAIVNSYATGLMGMTRGLALDLKPIRVNLVSPGAVDTELWANSGFSEKDKKNMLDHFEKTLPVAHIASPDEIAEAYTYILRDTNITGTVISTNGGHFLI